MFALTNSSTLSPHLLCFFRSKRRQKPPWPPSRTWWRLKTMTCPSVFTTADPPSRSSPPCRRRTSANPALPRGGQTSRRQSNSTLWWGEMGGRFLYENRNKSLLLTLFDAFLYLFSVSVWCFQKRKNARLLTFDLYNMFNSYCKNLILKFQSIYLDFKML